MAIETLNLTAVSIKRITWGGNKLRVKFGEGYFASALVGAAAGLHRFSLSMKALPKGTTNVGQISSKTWFNYYYEFFIARTTGADESFYITWDSRIWHAKFVETSIDFERFKGDIYSTGVELEQVRIVGTTYNADGSFTPAP